MNTPSIAVTYSLATAVDDKYFVRVEQVGLEKDELTLGQAAAVVNAAFDIVPCAGEEEGETAEPTAPEPVEEEVFISEIQRLLDLNLCDIHADGSFDAQIRVIRSDPNEPYVLRLTNGEVVQTVLVEEDLEHNVDVEDSGSVLLEYPVVGAASFEWSKEGGPEIHRVGNTLYWTGQWTGRIFAEYSTVYDLVDIVVYGTEDKEVGECQAIVFYHGLVDEETIEAPDADGDEQDWEKYCDASEIWSGLEVCPDDKVQCYEVVHQITRCQCSGNEFDRITVEKDVTCPKKYCCSTDSADEVKEASQGAADTAYVDWQKAEADARDATARYDLISSNPYSSSDSLTAAYEDVVATGASAVEAQGVYEDRTKENDIIQNSESVDEENSTCRHFVESRTVTSGYVDCGEETGDIADPVFYEETCCEPPPFGLPRCSTVYSKNPGGLGIENGGEFYRSIYGDDLKIVAVSPSDGDCGYTKTVQIKTAKNCCDGVAAIVWDEDESVGVLADNSMGYVEVIGGKPPYIWKVRGTGFWADSAFTKRDVTTNSTSIRIYTDDACGGCEIEVTDGCSTVTGLVKSIDGQWTTVGEIGSFTDFPNEVQCDIANDYEAWCWNSGGGWAYGSTVMTNDQISGRYGLTRWGYDPDPSVAHPYTYYHYPFCMPCAGESHMSTCETTIGQHYAIDPIVGRFEILVIDGGFEVIGPAPCPDTPNSRQTFRSLLMPGHGQLVVKEYTC